MGTLIKKLYSRPLKLNNINVLINSSKEALQILNARSCRKSRGCFKVEPVRANDTTGSREGGGRQRHPRWQMAGVAGHRKGHEERTNLHIINDCM